MKSVYILMHERKSNVIELAESVANTFLAAGIQVAAEPWLFDLMGEKGLFSGQTLEGAEAIVSVGGDGTLLRANALAIEHDLPVFGVNVGRVGFLTEVELEHLEAACARIANDDFDIETRMLLEADVEGRTVLALNDVVVTRGGYTRLISFSARVGGEIIGNYIADGIIVSTPTGSTGYSLSAGGPIVCPEVECMLITPVCAHSLQHRPVITSADQTVSIQLDSGLDALVSVDGQETFHLRGSQLLTVSRSARRARFIRLRPGQFFHKIRVKLSEWSC